MFHTKQKYFAFGTKIAYLSAFTQSFGKNVTFKISTFEFVKMVTLMQNKKALNLGTKLPYLGNIVVIIITSTIIITSAIVITSTIKSIRRIHRGSNS